MLEKVLILLTLILLWGVNGKAYSSDLGPEEAGHLKKPSYLCTFELKKEDYLDALGEFHSVKRFSYWGRNEEEACHLAEEACFKDWDLQDDGYFSSFRCEREPFKEVKKKDEMWVSTNCLAKRRGIDMREEFYRGRGLARTFKLAKEKACTRAMNSCLLESSDLESCSLFTF